MMLNSKSAQSLNNDAPVLIVSYGGRKRLMLKSHSYQEMIKLIRQKFNIDSEDENEIMLTVSLDVGSECGGCKVEIDEDVWPVIRCNVDQVVVVVGTSTGVDINAHSPRTDVDEPVTGPSHSGIVSASDSVSGSSVRTLVDNDGGVQDQGVVEGNQPERAHEHKARVNVEQRVDADVNVGEEVHGGRNVEDVEGISMNQDLDEGDHEESHPNQYQAGGESGQRSTGYTENMNIFQQLRRSVSQVQSHPQSRSQSQSQNQGHSSSYETNSSLGRSIVSPKERRFKVQITGPGPNQAAEIKTRGEHTVKKVLSAVCKTFNLDYDQSVLYVLRRHQDLAIRCPYDWTMARCGITSKSMLIVTTDQGRVRRSR